MATQVSSCVMAKASDPVDGQRRGLARSAQKM
jgi:hypothetical protein